MNAIRDAQLAADDPPNIYLSATCLDYPLFAGDHYAKEGYDKMGVRMGRAVLAHFGAAKDHRQRVIEFERKRRLNR